MKAALKTASCIAMVLALVLSAGCGSDQEPSMEEIGRFTSTITNSLRSSLSMADMFDQSLFQTQKRGGDPGDETQQITEGVDDGGQQCVGFSWSGLSATVTFDHCVLSSGEVLDGAVTLSLVLSPYYGISLTCGQLTLGDQRLDGWMGLAVSGPIEDLTVSVGVDMGFEDATSRLELRDTLLSIDADRAYIEGQGHAAVDGSETDFGADQLVWMFSDCLPSAGSLSFTIDIPVRVTFTAATPATGIVLVEYGGIGPFEAALFPACQ